MKKLCIIVGILLMSLLFVRGTQGRTFTQDEVLAIYQATAHKMGGAGTLSERVNTASHDNFPWTWNVHYIHNYAKGCNLAKRVAHANSSTGYSFILYMFVDSDLDGILDYVERRWHITHSDDGAFVVPYYPESSLGDALNEWALNIPNAQELYEQELEFWWNKLGLG